jgi:hypothetical protein
MVGDARTRTWAGVSLDKVDKGMVIQLDPEQCDWGPLLCIVQEVRSWGVVCYALIPERRKEPPATMFIRVKEGHYVVVGKAEWALPECGEM